MKELERTVNFYTIRSMSREYPGDKELFKRVVNLYFKKVVEVIFSGFPYKMPGSLGFLQLCKDRNKLLPSQVKFWEIFDKASKEEQEEMLKGVNYMILHWPTDGYALSVRWYMGNPIDGPGPKPEWRFWFACRIQKETFKAWSRYFRKNKKELYKLPTKNLGNYSRKNGYVSITKHISQQVDL